ncbi:MAG: acyl carrier protein [Haliea sp.]|nr:acyl carrier protein [Haliea sp.]
MTTRKEIYDLLCSLLVNMFEVDLAVIRPTADLYKDLDVDSIDAVDLIVELRNITGTQIDPEVFKEVRTVDDVVDAVSKIVGVE